MRPAAALAALAAAAIPAAISAAVSAAVPAAAGPRLEVLHAGAPALAADLGADGRWCLAWNHSVTGAEVLDCFRADDGMLVLERSRQPDFSAAGLGHVPGRGRLAADGAWVEGIDAALPDGLVLRVGSPRVRHRLRVAGAERPLPSRLAGERVVIRLAPGG